MKVFLDANILVSVLNNEVPLLTYTARILSLADHKKFKVYTSPLCLAIAFYFSEKKSGHEQAKKKIALLNSKINITDLDGSMATASLTDKRIKDFEDGMQYFSAVKAGCKCIITEDTDDFYFANIEVSNSKDFVEKYLL
jgi:predicted nucleic acid-binding protein